MNKPKGNKKQGQRAKGQARAAKRKVQPGIIDSWENFDETAMREYLDTVAEDFGKQMDALEEALRCEN